VEIPGVELRDCGRGGGGREGRREGQVPKVWRRPRRGRAIKGRAGGREGGREGGRDRGRGGGPDLIMQGPGKDDAEEVGNKEGVDHVGGGEGEEGAEGGAEGDAGGREGGREGGSCPEA
jgi:hypothetical protein